MNQIQQKIYKHILESVGEGTLLEGHRIKSEVALSKEFATNRMNVSYAIAKLKECGVLRSNKKQGTLVNSIPSNFELSKLKGLVVRRLYVLNNCPKTYRGLHWNDKLQKNMQAILDKANIETEYIYTENLTKASEYEKLIKEITENGSNAILLILRDENGILFKNINLTLQYQKHIFIYNRGITSWLDLPVNSVSIDAFNDGCITGDYLLKKGYKNIVFCFTNRNNKKFWGKNIIRGLKMSIKRSDKKGIAFKQWQGEADDIYEHFVNAGNRFALIVYSHENAAKIIDFFSAKGLKLKKDYGIFVLDSPYSINKNDSYKLTAISYSFDLIGKRLGKMIAKNIDHESKENFCVKIESEIIENNSC